MPEAQVMWPALRSSRNRLAHQNVVESSLCSGLDVARWARDSRHAVGPKGGHPVATPDQRKQGSASQRTFDLDLPPFKIIQAHTPTSSELRPWW